MCCALEKCAASGRAAARRPGLRGKRAHAADTVSVRLSYTPFAAHIPVYVAKAKGYYEQAGLDVHILPGRGSTFAAMTVGAARRNSASPTPPPCLAARAKGVPIIAVANLQQDNGVALIATEKSGITKVEDTQGPQCRHPARQHHDDLPAGPAQEARHRHERRVEPSHGGRAPICRCCSTARSMPR